MEKNDEAVLAKIGEAFGDRIGDLVARCVVKSVTVTDVDEDENIALVTIYDGDEPMRVPLQMLNAGDAVLKVIPTVGSTAAIIGLDGNIGRAMFVSYTSIDTVQFTRSKTQVRVAFDPEDDSKDEVNVTVGDSAMRITADEIAFNGGENNGLVLAESLCSRLNAIEDDINSLKQVFSSWVVAPQDGGNALKTAASSWAAQTLQKTTVSDVENKKILQ